MNLRTYRAEKLPCIVTVWEDDHQFYGKSCHWIDRIDDELCVVILGGKTGYAHRKFVAIGDNSKAGET